MNIEDIAKVCHAANRAYCQTLGDYSQPIWEEAPQWQKQSAINGVQFHLNNSWADPSAMHDNWMAQKQAEGWKYGPVKDPEKKEHPCMVPYEDLPPEQKRKDLLFIGVVAALTMALRTENSDET